MQINWLFVSALGIVCLLIFYKHRQLTGFADQTSEDPTHHRVLKNFAVGAYRGMLTGTAMGGVEYGIISGITNGFVNGIMTVV
jgi:hypothetical protein